MNGRTCFFCGIGGSGMNPLAQVLRAHGHTVIGSDRGFDRGENAPVREALAAQGIQLVPQDGSGVTKDVTTLVVSSAVEPTIPDVKAAMALGIPIRKRAELLAELCNTAQGVAIGGTSGKSTVTAMAGHILVQAGRDPTVVNGAVMLDAVRPPFLGNAVCGVSDLVVAEADESDGTIALYRPQVGVVTNISLDHKPMPELRALFAGFCRATRRTVVLNADCPEASRLTGADTITFGLDRPAEMRATALEHRADGTAFTVDGVGVELRQIGRHNVANALAAMAACRALGVSTREAAVALASFSGVERRLQVVGRRGGVTVIDDFAHNPDKIAASLSALRQGGARLLVMFQPHGFGPTRFLRDGFIQAFTEGLGESDLLVMPEIYYAGGTAEKTISSKELIDEIAGNGRHAEFIPDRADIPARLLATARPGDTIVVMGARDPGLTPFAQALLQRLPESP